MRHDLPGTVYDQEEIAELVAVTVVVQQCRHEQRVVLQARVRVVDALVERRDDVALQPRPMHDRRVVFGQERPHGALHTVARELLWVVPTLALDEREPVECLVVVHRLLRLPVGTRERRRIAVRAVGNRLVHRDARERLRRVVVRLTVHLVGIVAVGGDHHVLAAVALEVAEAGVLSHLRSLGDTAFQRLHEHRAVLLGPLVVLFVHLVRVALPAVVVVEVALVDVLFHEVRVGLAGMAGGAVVLVDDALHPVAKPPGEVERRG